MQVDRYKHFKWTPRTAWLSILFAVAIPSSLYYVANKTDVSRLFLCPGPRNRMARVGDHRARGGTREGIRNTGYGTVTKHNQDGIWPENPQHETLVTRNLSCKRWQDEDTLAQGFHYQAPKPRPNSRSTILETTNTNCIICRASTSFAAREEATP